MSQQSDPVASPDVVVIGEVLVEVSSVGPLVDRASARLSFSGDALNVAAAAAAAGARCVLVAKVPADELGDALVARAASVGIDTNWIIRSEGQHGLYLSHCDPSGAREFTYLRQGSLGSRLAVEDLDDTLLANAGIVVASGIACAISEVTAAAVRHAAKVAKRFLYDPNFRPRLTSSEAAAAVLREIAPFATVVVPSWPSETTQLLDLGPETSAETAVAEMAALGARSVVMTCGADGALVASQNAVEHVSSIEPPQVVDQTGAGDCFAGTLAARLALGDSLHAAVRLACAAAALSVQGPGGLGHIPSLEQALEALSGATARESAG